MRTINVQRLGKIFERASTRSWAKITSVTKLINWWGGECVLTTNHASGKPRFRRRNKMWICVNGFFMIKHSWSATCCKIACCLSQSTNNLRVSRSLQPNATRGSRQHTIGGSQNSKNFLSVSFSPKTLSLSTCVLVTSVKEELETDGLGLRGPWDCRCSAVDCSTESSTTTRSLFWSSSPSSSSKGLRDDL
jgi:hypothetical protein